MRSTFMRKLIEMAQEDKDIFLVVGDLGYSVVEEFQLLFPDRFINAGISEQNMMGLSAGLASEGKKVFVYSIANFPTFRCAEQVRNDVCYHNLPVVVVSVGGGLVYGNMGYSHHAVQDYGLMRLFPEMQILAPGDDFEVEFCMESLQATTGPSYLRLGNPKTEKTHKTRIEDNSMRMLQHIDGDPTSTKALVTTGGTLALASEWRNRTEFAGFCLYSVPIWGEPHRNRFITEILKFKEIVTVEDHLLSGGFGSWVLECTQNSSELSSINISVRALASTVTQSVGGETELRRIGGLH